MTAGITINDRIKMKIGDKVKVKKVSSIEIGEIVAVRYLDSRYYVDYKDESKSNWFYTDEIEVIDAPYAESINTPSYYDNSKGSLYKVATERGWNTYLFDVIKRLERGGKKDPLEQEIDKTITLLELWKKEHLKEIEGLI